MQEFKAGVKSRFNSHLIWYFLCSGGVLFSTLAWIREWSILKTALWELLSCFKIRTNALFWIILCVWCFFPQKKLNLHLFLLPRWFYEYPNVADSKSWTAGHKMSPVPLKSPFSVSVCWRFQTPTHLKLKISGEHRAHTPHFTPSVIRAWRNDLTISHLRHRNFSQSSIRIICYLILLEHLWSVFDSVEKWHFIFYLLSKSKGFWLNQSTPKKKARPFKFLASWQDIQVKYCP